MFLANKYTKWYFNIIKSAESRDNIGYRERHHILPKSLGGLNDSTNLIELTAREHFICHLLLTKMFDNEAKYKMIFAFTNMARTSSNQTRYNINSRWFAILKGNQKHSKESKLKMSISAKNRPLPSKETINKRIAKMKGRPSPLKGRQIHSEESKNKIREANFLRYKNLTAEEKAKLIKESCSSPQSWTDARRQKISKSRLGKTLSNETRKNMSISMKKQRESLTPEQRAKYGDSHRGKPWSEARRAAYLTRKEK